MKDEQAEAAAAAKRLHDIRSAYATFHAGKKKAVPKAKLKKKGKR